MCCPSATPGQVKRDRGIFKLRWIGVEIDSMMLLLPILEVEVAEVRLEKLFQDER